MSLRFTLVAFGLSFLSTAQAQTQFPYPITPFNESHEITGSFSEYRSTSATGHFHNGTDLPKPDHSPVYPVKNGTIRDIRTSAEFGTSAYVRVEDVAYVHIEPNPALSIGDPVVASETVLGTILAGQGHVHFTNGFVGSEKISILPNSGLTPFEDPWPPVIRFIRFVQNNTTQEFQGTEVSGLVDIIVKVDESNGPPSSNSARHNNGTYKIGYKILSADTNTVVFEPSPGGLRFQFDTKPNNNYVNTVYFRPLSSTTSHVYQVTNNVNGDNFWNTAAFPNGDYVVMAFTEDTRGNTDTAYVRVTTKDADLQPPAQPVFSGIRETENGMRLEWFPNNEPDLLGYRLDFSFDNRTWTPFRGETVLTPAVTDATVPQILNRDVYFRLTAVDDAPVPNESFQSDVYGMSNGGPFTQKVLLVDGFDRTSGGWTRQNHDFGYLYGSTLLANGLSFDTVPNEAVEQDLVQLGDYPAVFWILGDESAADETFSTTEQEKVMAYFENGGALFVSGSDVAFDLSESEDTSEPDRAFLHDYLHADFVSDDAGVANVTGVAGSIFEGLSFEFSREYYLVQAADVISARAPATACLTYETGQVAGLQFDGTSAQMGKLVYLAFPFETIAEESRSDIIERAAGFFNGITGVADKPGNLPREFALLPNYPNPFNPGTNLTFELPERAHVKLTVYNAKGQQIKVLLTEDLSAGQHLAAWTGKDDSGIAAASGIYFVRMQVTMEGNRKLEQTRKIALVK